MELTGRCGPFGFTTSVSNFVEFVLTTIAMLLCRALWRHHWDMNSQRQLARRNILIVGVDPVGREVRDYLSSLQYMGFRFKGFVALNEGSDDRTQNEDSAVVGNVENLITLAKIDVCRRNSSSPGGP